MSPTAQAIGRRLRRIRRHRGLTQHALSEKVPCAVSAISYYERGRYTPRRRRLFRLAEVLDCDIRWLDGFPDADSPLPESALELASAAHEQAKKERLPCKEHETRGKTSYRCTLWAFHPPPCSYATEASDV